MASARERIFLGGSRAEGCLLPTLARTLGPSGWEPGWYFISYKEQLMTPIKDTAERFFDACETGKGWEVCKGTAIPAQRSPPRLVL